jgi:predicted anti-sigma-YlaC factor YlaD
MTCEEVRVALSARLDGEDPGAPAGEVDRHTEGCSGCHDWQARAERATRTAVAAPAAVPDLTVPILAAVSVAAADERRRSGAAVRGRRQILRVAVAVLAFAQLVAALPVLFGVAPDAHTGREMASFDVALAVGFALVALRPERASALVPVAFVLAACLAATSAFDIASSRTEFVHEVGHLASVVQAAALWALGRSGRDLEAPIRSATAAGRE